MRTCDPWDPGRCAGLIGSMLLSVAVFRAPDITFEVIAVWILVVGVVGFPAWLVVGGVTTKPRLCTLTAELL